MIVRVSRSRDSLSSPLSINCFRFLFPFEQETQKTNEQLRISFLQMLSFKLANQLLPLMRSVGGTSPWSLADKLALKNVLTWSKMNSFAQIRPIIIATIKLKMSPRPPTSPKREGKLITTRFYILISWLNSKRQVNLVSDDLMPGKSISVLDKLSRFKTENSSGCVKSW